MPLPSFCTEWYHLICSFLQHKPKQQLSRGKMLHHDLLQVLSLKSAHFYTYAIVGHFDWEEIMKFNVFRQWFAFYFVSGSHLSREEKELQPHQFLQSSVSFMSCWLKEGYSFLQLSLSILRGRQAMVASGAMA